MADMDRYLRPTSVLDFDTPELNSTVLELTEGLRSARDKSIAIFRFVRDEIKYRIFYDDLSLEQFKASRTLKRAYGFCIPKADLLAALSRGAGIPARLHFADIRNHQLPPHIRDRLRTDLMTWHGYVEMFIEDRWISANPAFDITLCNKYGFNPVEFNGYDDALFHKYDRKGRLHIEYIKDLGVCDDLPYNDMISAFKRVYGSFQVNERH